MNHKPLFIFFIFICWSFSAKSQNLKLIDSLKSQLKIAKGEKKFELLDDLAWEYRWAFPDSTIYYANEAYKLGNSLKLNKLAEPLNFIGVAYNYKGDNILSFENYQRALQTSLDQQDSLQIAYSNNNLGRLFFEQGLLSRAYEHFVKCLAIFDALGDSSGLAYTYQSLANLYKSQKDFTKAESNYLKAYTMRIGLGNTRDIMSALTQLGRLYQEIDQNDKAIKYFLLADSAGNAIRDHINLAEIKTFLAESYLNKGLLKQAEAMCAEGLDAITKTNNLKILPHAYVTMGQIKMESGDLGAAKRFLDLGIAVAAKTSDLTSKMEAHYWLWKIMIKQNNRSEGLKNHNEYLILKDSIKDLDLTRQVERLQFEIEIQRKEQENNLLKATESENTSTIKQQKLQNIILFVVIGFISILGYAQYRNSKKRRESNEKLAQQNQFIQNQRAEIVQQNEKLFRRNQELSDLNHEKDTLMSIVAHDLKSPLNRIKGIISIMEAEQGLTEDQTMYVKLMNDATQSGLDLIKDLLDVHMLEENVEPTHSKFDISQFLFEKVAAFKPAAEAKNIHLHITRVESEEITLDADYLNRILDNLLTNAIKFSPKDSVIDVSGGKKEGQLWISIKDQGPGFSDKDRQSLFQKFKKLSARPTAGETSNGLGLAIVKTLVDRLKGKIELITAQGKGSEFIIWFPIASR
ncbi:tetratricopeptide repeat-containing sensor histidine kinase [Pseudochryseolinea flava]|uniref:tetratricopeptide repeat-containing sensor histidine kinase n=1 Tax=Pseudochryseolinea flava TaxID=2059302 RepID=UPI0014020BD5|nr:tetratricopeptide repeat-containing sensor histidine kinase [Pseudochryseolinea flava]